MHGTHANAPNYDEPELSLVYERQLQLPPFRDNYQTSVYYAALRALGLKRWFDSEGRPVEHPQLFEIGHSGPRTLVEDDTSSTDCITDRSDFGRVGRALREVASEFGAWVLRQPSHGVRRSWTSLRFAFAGFVLLGFILWFVRRRNIGPEERMSVLEFVALWGGTGVTYVFVLAVSAHGVTGEPFELAEGISIWPTEIVRVFVFFLSLFLIGRTHRLLRRNGEELSDTFKIGRLDPGLASKLRRLWAFRWSTTGEGKSNDFETVWHAYLVDTSRSRRVIRASVLTVIYFVVVTFFLFGSGHQPSVPARDPFALTIDRVRLFASLIAMVFLLMTVVDMVILAERFIKVISEQRIRWPDATYENWGLASAEGRLVRHGPLSEWLTIQLVGRRTEVLGNLVIGPFLVLALFVLSRASLLCGKGHSHPFGNSLPFGLCSHLSVV